jgi:lysophospholipase L1-like esterase
MSTQEIVSNIFDLETREIELNKYEVIRKALEKSDRFNDGVHPNHQCHQALAEELIAHFNL